MPQLNLTWWLFNFLLGWLSTIIIFTILINKNLLNKSLQPQNPLLSKNNNNQWPWN
uniref:ATP synthase complex subunit 8 n=1 Tax=Ceramaster japonicus TaxID=2482676 RepID=A0A7R7IB41_9ECHI|nr:ATPase subuint 8 [Ceramaster japonicus]